MSFPVAHDQQHRDFSPYLVIVTTLCNDIYLKWSHSALASSATLVDLLVWGILIDFHIQVNTNTF